MLCNITYMNTGELIRLVRSRTGLSQQDFAKRIGVSRPTVTQWENGDHSPRKSKVLAIIENFEIENDLKDALLVKTSTDNPDDFKAIASGNFLRKKQLELTSSKTSIDPEKITSDIVNALFDMVIAGEITFRKGADPKVAASHIYNKVFDVDQPLKMVAENSRKYGN